MYIVYWKNPPIGGFFLRFNYFDKLDNICYYFYSSLTSADSEQSPFFEPVAWNIWSCQRSAMSAPCGHRKVWCVMLIFWPQYLAAPYFLGECVMFAVLGIIAVAMILYLWTQDRRDGRAGKKQQKIANLQIVMKQASESNLEEAGHLLRGADMYICHLHPGNSLAFHLPPEFWEVGDYELIAKTLLTVSRFHEYAYKEDLEKLYRILAIFLSNLPRRNRRHTMAVISEISRQEPKMAKLFRNR